MSRFILLSSSVTALTVTFDFFNLAHVGIARANASGSVLVVRLLWMMDKKSVFLRLDEGKSISRRSFTTSNHQAL